MQPTWWSMHEQKKQHKTDAELPVSSSTMSDSNGNQQQPSASRDPGSKPKQESTSATAASQAKSLQDFASAMQALSPWADPTPAGSKRPPSRYEHAAQIVGRMLYIVGGNCSEPSAQSNFCTLHIDHTCTKGVKMKNRLYADRFL